MDGFEVVSSPHLFVLLLFLLFVWLLFPSDLSSEWTRLMAPPSGFPPRRSLSCSRSLARGYLQFNIATKEEGMRGKVIAQLCCPAGRRIAPLVYSFLTLFHLSFSPFYFAHFSRFWLLLKKRREATICYYYFSRFHSSQVRRKGWSVCFWYFFADRSRWRLVFRPPASDVATMGTPPRYFPRHEATAQSNRVAFKQMVRATL